MELKERPISESVLKKCSGAGLPEIAARIVAGRLAEMEGEADAWLNPGLEVLTVPPMKGLGAGAKRLAENIRLGETIVIVGDYDVDGLTGSAILSRAITEILGHPPERTVAVVGDRHEDGYGLTDSIVSRILAMDPIPGLVITVDCGSSDALRIERLARMDVEVVVTDHHRIEEPPEYAMAVINPNRPDCNFPDKQIAGCTVAWLLAAATAAYLDKPLSSMTALMDYAALGTVADCVSLFSPVNRMLVRAGLADINAGERPCWKAFLNGHGKAADAGALGFQLGPRVNAASRMATAEFAREFFMADTAPEAEAALAELTRLNERRKRVQNKMIAATLETLDDTGDDPAIAVIYRGKDGDEDREAGGVRGIVAGRLCERFHRPVIVFTQKDGGFEGSGRAPEGIDLFALLQRVEKEDPCVMERFGGHEGAAGLSVDAAYLETFETIFQEAVTSAYGQGPWPAPTLTDGSLLESRDGLVLSQAAALEAVAPYGRGFPEPLFADRFRVMNMRFVGGNPVHLKLTLTCGKRQYPAIQFFAIENPGDPPPVAVGERVTALYRPEANEFRGNVTLQLKIDRLIGEGEG